MTARERRQELLTSRSKQSGSAATHLDLEAAKPPYKPHRAAQPPCTRSGFAAKLAIVPAVNPPSLWVQAADAAIVSGWCRRDTCTMLSAHKGSSVAVIVFWHKAQLPKSLVPASETWLWGLLSLSGGRPIRVPRFRGRKKLQINVLAV